MAEGLQTPDGKKLELEAAEQTFAAAMAAPETDVPAPRKMTAEQKQAIKDEPKRTRRTTAKTEKPRTAAKGPQKVDKDFTEEISSLTTGLWVTTAAIPYTAPYAVLIKQAQTGLVTGLNQGAQNNATIRGYVEKASSGGGGIWMVTLGVTTAQMAMGALQIARDPELRRQCAEQTKADLQMFLDESGIKPVETEAANAGTDAS